MFYMLFPQVTVKRRKTFRLACKQCKALSKFRQKFKPNSQTLTLSGFRKHASGAVDAASTHSWMNDVYEAMGVAPPYQKGNSRESYLKDEIRAVYKKYRTLSEFKSKHKSYYSDALKLGMQKELIEN